MSDRIPTPQDLRAAADEALRDPGLRRIRLLAELEAVEAELRPLVANAVRNEVSLRRISVLTALSKTTVAAWAKTPEQEDQ